MNHFKRFSIASVFVFFFLALNVSCLRGSSDNGNTVVSEIRSHNGDLSENLTVSNTEDQTEEVVNHFVNGIVSALEQNATASFLEGGSSFNFKEEAKAQAKIILKEMLKSGIEPLQSVIAESIKPPTIPRDVYRVMRPVIVALFNKVENTLKVQVPDSIWDIEEEVNSSNPLEDDDDDLDF